jgi:quinol monooxygenase YgiN
MIVARFKVQCWPERTEEMGAATAVEAPSREIPGVVHFDAARSLTDPDTFVVIDVFEDRHALERQNAQGEVAKVLTLIEAGALTGAFEWTVWEPQRRSRSGYARQVDGYLRPEAARARRRPAIGGWPAGFR